MLGAELVHLVQHEDRIARAGLAQLLRHDAGQRTDVGAAMAADLRLVVDAAQARAHELQAERARDALAERGLAHAGRADEAQDRAAALRVELAHGQVLEDPLLDLGQAEVVLVENLPGARNVDRLGIELRPGQGDEPVEVGAHHRVLGRFLRHPLEPLELLGGLLGRFLGHLRVGDGLAQVVEFAAFLAFAELGADRLHLLAEVELALTLVDLFLRLLFQLPRQLQHLDLVIEEFQHLVEAGAQLERLEDLLLVARLDVEEAGDQVGELPGRLDAVRPRRRARASPAAAGRWPRWRGP